MEQTQQTSFTHYATELMSLLRKLVKYDGALVTIEDTNKERFCLVTHSLSWRLLDALPPSLTSCALQTQTAKIYDQPHENPKFNPPIDADAQDEISSLVLVPLQETTNKHPLKVAVCLYNHYVDALDQEPQPLMVGNQLVGFSSKVTRKKNTNPFTKDTVEKLQNHQHEILEIVRKLYTHVIRHHHENHENLRKQKEVLLSPQEIISALMDRLVGALEMSQNAHKLSENIASHIHRDNPALPHIRALNQTIKQSRELLLKSFDSFSSSETIRMLMQENKKIEIWTLLKSIYTSFLPLACNNGNYVSFFIHPNTPKTARLHPASTYTFLRQQLTFALEHTLETAPIYWLIAPSKKGSYLSTVLHFTPKKGAPDLHTLLFKENNLDHTIYWSYKSAISSGGLIDLYYDEASNRYEWRYEIPYEPSFPLEKKPTLAPPHNLSVAMVYATDKDLVLLNDIARYLLALKIPKSNIKLYKDPTHIPQDTTHLFVCESQADTFLRSLSDTLHTKAKIALLTYGCLEKTSLAFRNYAPFDVLIEANTLYLETLEEFIVV